MQSETDRIARIARLEKQQHAGARRLRALVLLALAAVLAAIPASAKYASQINLLGLDGVASTDLVNAFYPKGSIYCCTDLTTVADVETQFGGKWEAYGAGRVLVGMGQYFDGVDTINFDVVNSSGGSAMTSSAAALTTPLAMPIGRYRHKLSESELAKHRHELEFKPNNFGPGNGYQCYGYSGPGYTTYAGEDYYHNNLQPYVTVYMYRRTS